MRTFKTMDKVRCSYDPVSEMEPIEGYVTHRPPWVVEGVNCYQVWYPVLGSYPSFRADRMTLLDDAHDPVVYVETAAGLAVLEYRGYGAVGRGTMTDKARREAAGAKRAYANAWGIHNTYWVGVPAGNSYLWEVY